LGSCAGFALRERPALWYILSYCKAFWRPAQEKFFLLFRASIPAVVESFPAQQKAAHHMVCRFTFCLNSATVFSINFSTTALLKS
jgi:hypothetical protein